VPAGCSRSTPSIRSTTSTLPWEGNNINPLNFYQNAASPSSYLYKPDPSRPVSAIEALSANSFRLTWQASARDHQSCARCG
jgi:hypothetical protein